MSRPCRDCGEPIDWASERGRNVPIDPTTKKPHRETCLAQRGRVADKLKRPSAHHTSPSKIKRHEECQKAYFFEVVEEVARDDSTDAQDSGKLEHAAVEFVAVERAKANDLVRPLTGDELLAALDVVVVREAWSAESLSHAREVLVKAAPKIDLSFAGVDQHGPLVERKFELPAGAGVLVGGILDLVEFVGNAVIVRDWKGGAFREPRPEKLPAVGIYSAWARLMWPEREVRVVLQYLAIDHEDEIAGADLEVAQENAKALARALVLKTRARAQASEAWPANFGGHCSRCPYTSRCETYRERIGSPVDGREPETLEEIVREIHRLSPVATVAEKRVKELRERAKPLVAPHVDTFGRAIVAGYPVRLKTITRKGYVAKESTYQQLDVDDPAPQIEAAPEPKQIPSSGASPVDTAATTVETGPITRKSRAEEAAETIPETVKAEPKGEPSGPAAHVSDASTAVLAPGGGLPSSAQAPAVPSQDSEAPHAVRDRGERSALPDEVRGTGAECSGSGPAPAADAPNQAPAPQGVSELTPPYGTPIPSLPFALEDGLARIGPGQVRHVQDLMAVPDEETAGAIGSAIFAPLTPPPSSVVTEAVSW